MHSFLSSSSLPLYAEDEATKPVSPTSSPTSSSVSDFGSESRPSTPSSSIRSVSPAHEISCRFPTDYIFLHSYDNPNVLAALFERHSQGGILGLSPQGCNWLQENLKLDSEIITYYRSPQSCGKLEFNVERPMITTSPTQAKHLFAINLASLRALISFPSTTDTSTLCIVEKPAFVFPPLSRNPSLVPSIVDGQRGNVPTPEEWNNVWSAWDMITLQMIPQEMLHQKPIDLRHKCLFYIGHIPTFLDMLLSKSIGGSPSEPGYFWNIFERGIDPHVDDPDHCHNHSDVPERDEDWPTIDTIIGFRNRVRARLMRLYDDIKTGKRVLTRNIARTLVMTLEHEGFHIETMLYMLIQRAGTGTLPPPGFIIPPFELLTLQWNSTPPPSSQSVILGPATVTLGHEDSEADDKHPDLMSDLDGHIFGWDNENPSRVVHVNAFKAEWRPVSNREFEAFWRGAGKGRVTLPKSWVEEEGSLKVRTMYGPVSMDIAQHWPVLTSYDDLCTYAQSKGGRLPTEPELRLFLDTYDIGHENGANSGFRNWHPIPANTGLDEYGGKGSNGGVWEWTSTLFDGHEGLVPTNLFTGYSVDFFDTKHQVVLGASYATIPRLAGRRTVRNFYQHNYPYPWVGGRVIYDL
ncbi:C-type lectin protein [Infundibulicybe gibba]|nr:C-type lectin protein [Infundibulicybe gibba]